MCNTFGVKLFEIDDNDYIQSLRLSFLNRDQPIAVSAYNNLHFEMINDTLLYQVRRFFDSSDQNNASEKEMKEMRIMA